MKFKLFVVLTLAASAFLVGCRGSSNTNANANANANTAVVTTPTPVRQTNEAATTDTAMKTRVENALKAKGFNDVTVDTSTTPMTIRGSVAKGKMAELMSTIQENNGGKPVSNQVTEK